MFLDDYEKLLHGQLDKLQANRQVVEEAASVIAEALRSGHYVFCSGIGHGIQGDFINRAGGMAAVRQLTWTLNVENPMPPAGTNRAGAPTFDKEAAAARAAIMSSNLRAGDIFVIGSVSGRNSGPVEAALAARELGAKVIVMTSMEYAKQTPSAHASNKSLYECADYILDLCTPYGDCAVKIAGYESELVPASGFGQVVAGWMLFGRVMELMGTDGGAKPVVFMSVNRAGGREAYDAAIKLFNERGF